jgi:hypothetical protein
MDRLTPKIFRHRYQPEQDGANLQGELPVVCITVNALIDL